MRSISLILFLIANICHAQTFAPLFPNPLVGWPVAWIDYDNDGDDDLMLEIGKQNGTEYIISTTLWQNDNGNFTKTDQVFDDAYGPVVTDWDVDGDLDVHFFGNKYYYLENKDGVFEKTGGSYTSELGKFKLLDFDNDGNLDWVAVDGQQIRININVQGTFSSSIATGIFGGISDFLCADFNNDGNTDILIKYSSGAIKLHLFDNDAYEAQENDPGFSAPTNPQMFAYDYDIDGDVDVVFSGLVDSKPENWLFINDDGTFSKTDVDVLKNGYVYFADLDGDDITDVINSSVDSTRFYINEGDGVYSKEPKSSYLNSFRDVTIAFSCDDGNGRLVYVTARNYDVKDAAHIYRKEGNTYTELYPNPLDLIDPLDVQFVDYNYDGLMDIFTAGAYPKEEYPGARPKLLRNTGTWFEVAHEFLKGTISFGQWVDFNKDGKIDFVTVVVDETDYSRDIFLFEGFVDGNVTSKQLISIPTYSVDLLQIADFDKDQDNDILIGGRWYQNNDGEFLMYSFDNSLIGYGSPAWADYDLDGDLDMVLYTNNGSSEGLRLYKDDGSQFTFDTETIFPAWSSRGHWMDYDNDGDQDLLATGSDYDWRYHIQLYRNDDGVFSAQPASVFKNLNEAHQIARTKVIDFNTDGFPDIMATGEDANEIDRIYFYLNNNGVFELLPENSIIPTFRDPFFDFADIESDGDQDILIFGGNSQMYYGGQIFINLTGDSQILAISSLSPKNNSTVVNANAVNLTIVFNKPVKKGTGSLKIYRKSSNAQVYSLDIGNAALTINGGVVSLKLPDGILENETDYYILVSAGAFVDYKNNPDVGITDNDTWNFSVNDTRSDQVISFTPIGPVSVSKSPFELTASSTSSLPVRYTSSNISVATVSGKIVSIKAIGSTTLTAYQDGNNSFKEATPVGITLTVVEDMTTGLADKDRILLVYPNPTKGRLIVSAKNFDPDKLVRISILDTYGRSLLELEAGEQNEVDLDLHHLPAGFYILSVAQGDVQVKTKFTRIVQD